MARKLSDAEKVARAEAKLKAAQDALKAAKKVERDNTAKAARKALEASTKSNARALRTHRLVQAAANFEAASGYEVDDQLMQMLGSYCRYLIDNCKEGRIPNYLRRRGEKAL